MLSFVPITRAEWKRQQDKIDELTAIVKGMQDEKARMAAEMKEIVPLVREQEERHKKARERIGAGSWNQRAAKLEAQDARLAANTSRG